MSCPASAEKSNDAFFGFAAVLVRQNERAHAVVRAHQIEKHARPVFGKAVELHFGQLERRCCCVLHRDNCRGVVRIDRAECGLACAHEFRGIGHHLLEQLQHLCRDIRCAECGSDRFIRVAAHADRFCRRRSTSRSGTASCRTRSWERHLLDALDVHRVQLVDGDLVRNRLGQRTFAVARAAHAVPAKVRHRIQPIGSTFSRITTAFRVVLQKAMPFSVLRMCRSTVTRSLSLEVR